jgi:hypothetical protein
MPGPVLKNSWGVQEPSFINNPLVSGSFRPAAGDLVVVKLVDIASIPSWTMSDSASALTWTRQVNYAPGGNLVVLIYTAPVVSALGSITVKATPSQNNYSVMLAEWWSGAKLAASPATGTGTNYPSVSGAPDFTITTAKAGSAVSWCSTDATSQSGSRTYITTSGTPVEEYFFNFSGNGSGTFAYQPAATAGTQTVGETAPTGQGWPSSPSSRSRALRSAGCRA